LSCGAGGYSQDGPLNSYDFVKPYLTLILSFMGISDVTTFTIEATTADPDVISTAKDKAMLEVSTHFSKL